MQPRAIGMIIDHQEIEHILQQMTDVLRNAAYKVARAKYPKGHEKYPEYFDEQDQLMIMDEVSIKALLKDAIDHYLQFYAMARSGSPADFNYYLGDSFAFVNEHINSEPHTLSYLASQFARACGVLAATLAPVVEDLSSSGHVVESVETFAVNSKESYYLVKGENPDYDCGYDPKEDDLSDVDVYQSPEKLLELTALQRVNNIIADTAEVRAGGEVVMKESIYPTVVHTSTSVSLDGDLLP